MQIGNEGENDMFIFEKKPKSEAAESFRTLRTNILYSSYKDLKLILVTSPEIKDGKSTIASNMALAFSKVPKRVLLVDCNLRKPSLDRMFGISNEYGLSEILFGNTEADKCIKKYNDNLYILSAGFVTKNPADMLCSDKMSDLLLNLKNEYDFVILDSAPVKEVTDAQILSTKVDGTLIVVRKNSTKSEDIKDTVSILKKGGGRILGVVFNAVSKKRKRKNKYFNDENAKLQKEN